MPTHRTLLLAALLTVGLLLAGCTAGPAPLDGQGPWVSYRPPADADVHVDGPLHLRTTFDAGIPETVQVRVPDGTTVRFGGRPAQITAGSTATFTGPDLTLTSLCRAGVCYEPPLSAPRWVQLAATAGPVDTAVPTPVPAPAPSGTPRCTTLAQAAVCVDAAGLPLLVRAGTADPAAVADRLTMLR